MDNSNFLLVNGRENLYVRKRNSLRRSGAFRRETLSGVKTKNVARTVSRRRTWNCESVYIGGLRNDKDSERNHVKRSTLKSMTTKAPYKSSHYTQARRKQSEPSTSVAEKNAMKKEENKEDVQEEQVDSEKSVAENEQSKINPHRVRCVSFFHLPNHSPTQRVRHIIVQPTDNDSLGFVDGVARSYSRDCKPAAEESRDEDLDSFHQYLRDRPTRRLAVCEAIEKRQMVAKVNGVKMTTFDMRNDLIDVN